MTGCARCRVATGVELERETLRLPAEPGIADSIGPPVLTRGRAVARQGVTPEQYLFGGIACHKKRQDAGTRGARQSIYCARTTVDATQDSRGAGGASRSPTAASETGSSSSSP